MANVVNRTTVQYLRSVNTPDYPSGSWLINPDLSALTGVPQKYWKVVGETVVEMTQPEKDAVDAAEAAAVLLGKASADQGTDEFETTNSSPQTVLSLAPTNSFWAGVYRIEWAASVKRQSNLGLVNIKLLIDSVAAFELTSIDPKKWVNQSGFVQTTWTEATHTVELQISSSTAGRAVQMKNAQLTAVLEDPNG